jgi:thiosulfate/3-mercaptopyruvate sulfurtransferase
MDSRRTIVFVGAFFAWACSSAGGQEERGEHAASRARLITFDALQQRLGEPHLRLLDARAKTEYDKGHIPGAIWVDVKSAEKLAASADGLNDRSVWARWIEPLGIGPDTEVVIYDAQRQLSAARTWWLLSYLGVEKVALIDGGFPLWAKQGHSVTTEVPHVSPRAFPVVFRESRHATRADVLESLKSGEHQIVDARSTDEHTGKEVRSKRGGRIPSACLLEWNTLVDPDGRFLDERTLRTKLLAIGVEPNKPIITHCQGGGRASVDAFVLERLGFPTRNYYLGWSDWGNTDETPVEKGSRQSPGK